MAGSLSRRKGANGERELFTLLAKALDIPVKRNLESSRAGGCDTLDIPGWSPEVKRTEVLAPSRFWSQTLRQARDSKLRPVLFWRRNHAPWVAFVDPHELAPSLFSADGDPISMSLDRWLELAAPDVHIWRRQHLR